MATTVSKGSSLQEVCARLERSGLVVEEAPGATLNARRGEGRRATRTNLDPQGLLEAVAKLPVRAAARQVAGWSRGVEMALGEGPRSIAQGFGYADAAAHLLPGLEISSFADGFEAARGERPFVAPFAEDLLLIYVITVVGGWRVLTESQVRGWGASSDRITSAGRSLLFHRTQNHRPRALDGGVWALRVGDGFDAARALVLADVYFSEVGPRVRMAMPTPDSLLFVHDGDAPGPLDALRHAADAHFAGSDSPLTRSLYRTNRSGTPELDEPRDTFSGDEEPR